MTYLLAKCSGKWGNIAGYTNKHRTHCCDIVCWIIMNSYIVRFQKNKSIIHWTWFYFLNQISCHMVASDILHLTIKNREAAVSSLLNRILLKTLCVMKWNSTKIILWTFLSTSEEMLLNCYNEAQCKLYEVSLHCLWFRLPVVDIFSKFTFYIDLFTN